MADSTETSAADMQAELQYLRQRNKELQSQLEKVTKQRDSGTISHDEDKEEKMSLSSSPDGGVELTEMTNIKGPPELVRSSSTSLDENSHSGSGLHHRRIASGDNVEHTRSPSSRSSSSPWKRGGCVKSKVSDVDLEHTTKNNGHLDRTPTTGLSKEVVFDDECNHNHISRSKGIKKSSNGGGNYEPPLLVGNGDEEDGRFSDVHNQNRSSLSSDDGEEIDDLIDDDSSHNKHITKIMPKSPSTLVSPSPSFPPFKDQIKERAGWLVGLLVLQSGSSFIIQYNENFLQNNMVIVQFLTMLVGAGGNAGNQASVGVIRSLAVGTLNRHTMKSFLKREAKMAVSLSLLLGMTGFIRAILFRTPPGETIAVTASVIAIVAISVAIGSTLPLGMKKVGIDPAHSSTSIQVIMDILGVLITVCVSSFVLSFKTFQNNDSEGG